MASTLLTFGDYKEKKSLLLSILLFFSHLEPTRESYKATEKGQKGVDKLTCLYGATALHHEIRRHKKYILGSLKKRKKNTMTYDELVWLPLFK